MVTLQGQGGQVSAKKRLPASRLPAYTSCLPLQTMKEEASILDSVYLLPHPATSSVCDTRRDKQQRLLSV